MKVWKVNVHIGSTRSWSRIVALARSLPGCTGGFLCVCVFPAALIFFSLSYVGKRPRETLLLEWLHPHSQLAGPHQSEKGATAALASF